MKGFEMNHVYKNMFKVKKYIIFQVILSFVAAVAIALVPACNRYLVDNIATADGLKIIKLIIVYMICNAVYLLSTWGAERYVWKTAIAFENSLKKECFDALTKMDFSLFGKKKQEEYLSILTNNITKIEQDYLQPICALIKSVLVVIIYAIIISKCTSSIICITLFSFSVIAIITPKLYKKRMGIVGKMYVDELATYTKKISDLLSGFELIDKVTRAKYSKKNNYLTDKLSDKRSAYGKVKVNGNTISGMAVCLIDVAIFGLCSILLFQGKITAGTILAAITYSQAFTDPIQEILYDINTLNSTKRVVDSFEEIYYMCEEASGRLTFSLNKQMTLKDVCICYSEKKLCYNATFDSGKKYIITGDSGSGKTTLLNLLLGRREMLAGSLLIDGKQGTLSNEDCFYLSQYQHVFQDDVVNNITIYESYPLISNDSIEQMDIFKHINGIADCSFLSGGEKQILKLYRALNQNKKTLILDEPFSAIDRKNAKYLFGVLSQAEATIIVVTHHLDCEEKDLDNWNIIEVEEICNEL